VRRITGLMFRTLACVVLAAALEGLAQSQALGQQPDVHPPPNAVRKTNIVFILVDNLGYGESQDI